MNLLKILHNGNRIVIPKNFIFTHETGLKTRVTSNKEQETMQGPS